MKIHRTTEYSHPILIDCINKIEKDVLQKYNAPFKIFETARTHERNRNLIAKGKTNSVMNTHLFDLRNDPPLYATAVDYVYFNGKWSWNLRDATITAWYKLFGNLVLDVCPELYWKGTNRRSMNLTHFELRQIVILDSIDKIPCVVN